MELVLAGINKVYLESIALQSITDCSEVIAIVPYCDSLQLFQIAKKANKKLTFYGRLDDTVPVPSKILKWFIDADSTNYICYLYRGGLHAKVIWFKGVGVYIGSANLTDNGWLRNIEAGVFIDEESLLSEDQLLEHLELLLDAVVAGRIAVDEAIVKRVVALEALRQPIYNQQDSIKKWFENAFVDYPKQPALTEYKPKFRDWKGEFLKEWNDTLALLRNIQKKLEPYKPNWITGTLAKGVHVDQFLHGVYYRRVGKGNSPVKYEENKSNPELALKIAMDWWKSGDYDHSSESVTINKWAPRVAELLHQNKIKSLTETELIELCSMVHAMREYALRAENALLGINKEIHTHAEKIEALGQLLYSSKSKGQKTTLQTIHYVLYEGSVDDVPNRLYDAYRNPEWKIKGLGLSSLGEIVGWAMPDYYPPRNGRTNKALRALGYDVSDSAN